jgi:hypothetical protein
VVATSAVHHRTVNLKIWGSVVSRLPSLAEPHYPTPKTSGKGFKGQRFKHVNVPVYGETDIINLRVQVPLVQGFKPDCHGYRR